MEMSNIVRRFYPAHWLAFMQQFSIGRDACQFDDFGQCIGLKIEQPYESVKLLFRRLRVVETTTEPQSCVVLYGVRKIRLIDFGTYVAVSEEEQ